MIQLLVVFVIMLHKTLPKNYGLLNGHMRLLVPVITSYSKLFPCGTHSNFEVGDSRGTVVACWTAGHQVELSILDLGHDSY